MPKNHESAKKQYIDQWLQRSFSLTPWTVGLASPGRNTNPQGFIGVGAAPLDMENTHTWSLSFDADHNLGVLGKALSGARRERLDEALDSRRAAKARDVKKAWNAEEAERLSDGKRARKEPQWPTKRNLTRQEKSRVETGQRPVTLMDCIWRLRIKANYEDAQMFTEGPDNDTDPDALLRDLHALAAATCLVHEIRIARILSQGALVAHMKDWAKRNLGTTPISQLANRIDLVENAC
jgi:hypothetical protein